MPTKSLIKRKKKPEPITTVVCCYCKHYHIKAKKFKDGTRLCGLRVERGGKERVIARSTTCGAFEFKKYYYCPEEKKRVSSIHCQVNRMSGFHNCLECPVFDGPPGHVVESAKHLPKKLKLIRRKK